MNRIKVFHCLNQNLLIIFILFSILYPLGISKSIGSETSAEIFLQLGHSYSVNSVSVGPNGKYIASGGWDNTVKIWNIRTGEPLRTLTGHLSSVNSVDFSFARMEKNKGDELLIVSGSADNTIKVWEVKTGKVLHTLKGHSDSVCSTKFSPDGLRIVSGGLDNTVRVWDVKTGQMKLTLCDHAADVYSVCFSPDGKLIASGSWDNTINIWDSETGITLKTLTGHSSHISSVAFSHDGRRIISGSWDHTIKIWNIETGNVLQTLTGHESDISTVAISPDEKFIASGSSDDTVKLWDAKNGKLIRTLTGHSSFVNSVSYSPDSTFLVSGSLDNTIKIWNAKTGKLIKTLSGYTSYVYSTDFSPNGKFIVSAGSDEKIRIWEAKTGSLVRTLSGHASSVSCVRFDPQGRRIVSASFDDTARIWDFETGNIIHTLSGHTSDVSSVCFSPDGLLVVSGSFDNTVCIWNSQTGERIRTLTGHSSFVNSVSFSPDGEKIASGSWDHTVIIWNSQTGNIIHILKGHSADVYSVDFSPDGKYLASGSLDDTARIWEVETGKIAHVFNTGASYVYALSFCPEGRSLAVGNRYNTIQIWDITSENKVQELEGHTSSVSSVCFSPGGKFIVSGGLDNTVRLFNLNDSKIMLNIMSLPGGEWLSWRQQTLFYNSSLQGDEYAAICFDNDLTSVYPLFYYRDTLKRSDWTNYIFEPQPDIVPKTLRLWRRWWARSHYKEFWTITFLLGLSLLLAIFVISLRRRYDPLDLYRKFFIRAGFKYVEYLPGNLLLLYTDKGKPKGMAAHWQEGKSGYEITEFIEQYAVNSSKKFKLYLIYNQNRPSSRDLHMLRESLPCAAIPINSMRLEKAMTKWTEAYRYPSMILKEIEEPFLARIDPYAETLPIHDPTWFFGRDDLIERFLIDLAQGQNIGVFGMRKVGKTSLIQQVQQRFTTAPIIYIDCYKFSSNAEVYFDEILQQIRIELRIRRIRGIPSIRPIRKIEDFSRYFLQLYNAWKKTGREEPFAIIMDEIDKFFPCRQHKGSEAILYEYVRFFNVIRGLIQTHRCLTIMVVSCRPDVNRFNMIAPTIGDNPMFRSFQEVYIGFLNPTDSARMIREIGLWKDILWEEEAARRVYYYCGGHPLVTRYFASIACRGGNLKYVNYARIEDTAAHIRQTFRRNEIGNYYSEGGWALLTEEEKQALSLICRHEEQITEYQIPTNLKDSLTNLENFGLVANQEGQLSITAKLFDMWLKIKVSG